MRVCGGLDGQAAKVEVEHELQGAGISKEYAEAGVRDDTAVTSSCGSDVDAASERPKPCQVFVRGATHFVRTRRSVAVWDEIVETDVVVKRAWPELWLKLRKA